MAGFIIRDGTFAMPVSLDRISRFKSETSRFSAYATIDLYLIRDTCAVIPAQAGKQGQRPKFRGTAIQQDKNAFCLNPLDSGLRRNDVEFFNFPNFMLNDGALSSIM